MTSRFGFVSQLVVGSLLLLGLLSCGVQSAQQPGCEITLPVTVLLPDGSLIRKLERDQFVVKGESATASLRSLAVESGPRRIVFVVENGPYASGNVRKIESTVIAEILSRSHPEDSFALITTQGARKTVRFGDNREELTAAVADLAAGKGGRNQSGGVLDSIQEATAWLTPHQPGDALVVLTLGVEHSRSRTSFKTLLGSLTSSGVRLFGFQLGELVAGYYGAGVAPLPDGPGFIPSAHITPNDESLDSLSRQTGGFIFIEPTDDPLRKYELTPQRLAALRSGATQIYKAIREYYSLTIESKAGFKVDVSEEVRSKLPRVNVAYPRNRETPCKD